jgi:circadian clock protein KaiC
MDVQTVAVPTSGTDEGFAKAPSGVHGLDEILGGGLPRGRPTLLCGGAGCGKTLLAMQFLCRGVLDAGEPGVFIAFEESEAELTANTASLGYDLDRLVADGMLAIDTISIDPTEIVETGEYDLEGLFIRIAGAVQAVGAKRIVIDTIEVLFGSLADPAIVRSELHRLFAWLKAQGLTAVITAERGKEGISRHGIEEYVSDCVILLDHRVIEEQSTRRLRVLKYRGSLHGTNEYPFLIGKRGIAIAPITSLRLEHEASSERVSTGVEGLDARLSGGFYRGSSVLISGPAGAGKTTFAAAFVDAACARGETALFISFEESTSQLTRNMRSVGFGLTRWVDAGLLRFETVRPTMHGLEHHLAWLDELLEEVRPDVVVIDPISSVTRTGTSAQVAGMLMRQTDLLKSSGATSLFTALIQPTTTERVELEITSLIDTWLIADSTETNGERDRLLSVVKSRGMAHSNQFCEFVLTDHGIELLDPYLGNAGVLTGSARLNQQLADVEDARRDTEVLERHERDLERQRVTIGARMDELHAELRVQQERLEQVRADHQQRQERTARQRTLLSGLRWAGEDRSTTADAGDAP